MTPAILFMPNVLAPTEVTDLPSEADLIDQLRVYLEGLFPKNCNGCGQQYHSLREYLQTTTTVGQVMSYDVDMGNWHPLKPIGTLTLANCHCGNTMALSSSEMPLPQLWLLLAWVHRQVEIRQQTPDEVLTCLRTDITRQVLA